jgi:tetratricopeptide (TPR) repeat protein
MASSGNEEDQQRTETATPTLREKGTTAYQSGQYAEAARLYKLALEKAPSDAALLSNLSATHLALAKQLPKQQSTGQRAEDLSKALAYAKSCVDLRPEWFKGYFRQAQVLEEMDRYVGSAGSGRKGEHCMS